MMPANDSRSSLIWLLGGALGFFLVDLGTAEYFRRIDVAVAVIRPGTGVALGILLVRGPYYWRAILAGALAAQLVMGHSLVESAVMAAGTTAGALLGAWVLSRDRKLDLALVSFTDYFRLVFWAGAIGAGFSTLTGGAIVFIYQAHQDAADMLLRWWMGDTLGILLMTPFLLVWRQPPIEWRSARRILDAGIYLAACFFAGQAIFMGWTVEPVGKVALGYWMFLFVVWGAARFGPHAVVVMLLMATIQAFWGAATHVGFFANDIVRTQLFNVWFYLFALSTVGMGLAASVTAIRESERRIRDMALHDSLTGLANRVLLTDRIGQAIASARRDGRGMALIFHDLDHFKPVNDRYGHLVGDELLRQVSARVLACVRESDTVGRIGGDEFVIVIPGPAGCDAAQVVAAKIHDALILPFDIAGHDIRISTSIGIALYPEHGSTEAELMVRADDAMYEAKRRGRNCIQIYSTTMMDTQRRGAACRDAGFWGPPATASPVEVVGRPSP